jgi:glycosyltransferase involved in cell wall biosynthesis
VTTTDISLALLLGHQLRELDRAGYDVVGASAPGPHVDTLHRWGIRHIALRHATRAMAPHRDIAALVELRSLFRMLRPDIVHTHNPKPGIYGRLAARAAGVPAVVNTVHGLYAAPDDRWAKRRMVYAIERFAARSSDAELVQNPEDVQTLLRIGVPKSKVQLLGNGVDLTRFRAGNVAPWTVRRLRDEMGAGPGDVVCGVVGRLVWEKGYAELFAAAKALRHRAPHVRVVVVGPEEPGKSAALSADDIRRAETDAGVRFLGMRDDIDALYAAMDFYLLASHREGFPRSAMEAAASGLPVIATDIRGCRQVVDDGVTGFLVQKGNAPRLADAMERLAWSAELRGRMGAAAVRKAGREFDERRVVEITLDVYRRLLRPPLHSLTTSEAD